MSENLDHTRFLFAHREYQTKYEYFVMGVILATLSLSTQTTSVGQSYHLVVFLIASWASWLISLLAGLYRLERKDLYFTAEIFFWRATEDKKSFEPIQKAPLPLKPTGQKWTKEEIDECLNNLQFQIDYSDKLREKHSNLVQVSYHIMKWSFVVGLLCYAIFIVSNINRCH